MFQKHDILVKGQRQRVSANAASQCNTGEKCRTSDTTNCVAAEKLEKSQLGASCTMVNSAENPPLRPFNNAVDLYFAEKINLSAATVKTYKQAANHFSSYIQNKNLIEITRRDIRRWRDDLMGSPAYIAHPYRQHDDDKLLTNSSIRRMMTSVRAIFNWLVREEEIEKSPFVNVTIPRREDLHPTAISDADIERMREEAHIYSGNKTAEVGRLVIARNRAIVEVLISTGARVGEIADLRRTNVCTETGEMIVIGKGGKLRKLFLTPHAAEIVQKWLDIAPECDFLFTALESNYGQQYVKFSIRSMLIRLGERAGCTGPHSPHHFRHWRAIKWLLNGMPLAQVSRLLGHSSIDVTFRHYGRFYDHQLKSEHAKYTME